MGSGSATGSPASHEHMTTRDRAGAMTGTSAAGSNGGTSGAEEPHEANPQGRNLVLAKGNLERLDTILEGAPAY